MTLTTLQAGRAFAAIAVVLFHANTFFIPERLYPGQIISPALNAGFAGVEYFFVLSGFVMMLVHQRDIGMPQQTFAFLQKRIIRIYPFYWANLLLLVLMQTLASGVGGGPASTVSILTSALLIPSEGFPPLVVAWTLSHEMLFYLLFSTLILNLRLGAVLLAGWCAAIAVNAIWMKLPFPGSFLFSPHNLLFFFGMAAALLFRRLPVGVAAGMAFTGLAAFVAIAVLSVLGQLPVAIAVRTVMLGVSGFALVCGLATLELFGKVKAPPVLVLLGDASYSIYLIHGVTLAAGAYILNRLAIPSLLPPLPVYLALVVGSVVAGVVVHLWVERPLLSSLRHLRGGRRAKVPA